MGKKPARILLSFAAMLLVVFAFRYLSYPLLWNDESDTVMNATQVLRFGYPKMHDDKNFVFLPDANDPTWIGYKHSYDANISMPWGSFYLSAPAVWVASLFDDIYLKTAIIRSFFVLCGLAGLYLFLLSLRDCIPDNRIFRIAAMLFILLCIFSVPLLLHIREARYYSLVIFLCGWFTLKTGRRYLHHTTGDWNHFYSLFWMLFLSYQVNVLTFSVLAAYLFVLESGDIVQGMFALRKGVSGRNEFLRRRLFNLGPVVLAGIFILPFFYFYETTETVRRAYAHYGFSFDKYLSNLKFIGAVLSTNDFLLWALVLKGLVSLCYLYFRKRAAGLPGAENSLLRFTFFLLLFGVIYALLAGRMPFFWTRYFIVLQPVLSLSLIADSILLFRILRSNLSEKGFSVAVSACVLAAGFFIQSPLQKKISDEGEYIYQMTHPLKGPLDYIIPFIREKYPHPDQLTVATNYEELCYIYYLGCRVTLGYVNKNYEYDMKIQPDVIVYRKPWGHDPAPYQTLLGRAPYERLSFPVMDTRTNNIAELNWPPDLQHRFRTALTDDENLKADLFFRTKR